MRPANATRLPVEVAQPDLREADSNTSMRPRKAEENDVRLTRTLLFCGTLVAPFFILTDIAAATLFYPGYDYSAQQVSELSAIGAPSRDFWMLMGYPYNLLTLAFAAGIWLAAGARWTLKLAAALIVLFAINSFSWGWVAPMHMRGTAFAATDAMHIAFAVSAVALMLGFIGFGAAAFGRGFRVFSAIIVVAMLAAGGVVSTQIPAIAANQPTPWMGLVERISVYGPMIWMAALAVMLLREAASDRGRVRLVGVSG